MTTGNRNWPNSQIPQCTCSHNAPFRTDMFTFLFWMVIWDRCIVGFTRLDYFHQGIIHIRISTKCKLQNRRKSKGIWDDSSCVAVCCRLLLDDFTHSLQNNITSNVEIIRLHNHYYWGIHAENGNASCESIIFTHVTVSPKVVISMTLNRIVLLTSKC